MNEPTENPSSTSLEAEMPSVVAASQRKSKVAIGIFLAFMALIAIVVCKKPKPKETIASVPVPDTTPSGPSLPAATVYPKMPPPIQEILARRNSMDSGDGGLIQVRRNSPMVIFNKNTASGGSARPSTTETSGLLASGSTQGDDGGVPLPSGFQPTNAQSAHSTVMGNRDFMLAQGKLIDAVLETAINSDHPGMLRAIISHDVYGDSGNDVLLPRGSRLIGQYNSAVAKGQNRVFVIWQRAIRPDGIDIQLGSAGTDTLGRTGIEGDVNNHFFTMFGAATLLSVIGATAATVGVSAQDQFNSLAQYRNGIAQSFNNAANTVLGQFAQIKPTISVKQGVDIKVFVGRDLYFDSDALSRTGIQVIP